jgi:hypothetical protein
LPTSKEAKRSDAAIMTLYRFSLLDRSDRIMALETVECDDDDAAEDFADQLLESLGYAAVEIWEGTERIYRAQFMTDD